MFTYLLYFNQWQHWIEISSGTRAWKGMYPSRHLKYVMLLWKWCRHCHLWQSYYGRLGVPGSSNLKGHVSSSWTFPYWDWRMSTEQECPLWILSHPYWEHNHIRTRKQEFWNQSKPLSLYLSSQYPSSSDVTRMECCISSKYPKTLWCPQNGMSGMWSQPKYGCPLWLAFTVTATFQVQIKS